MRIPSKIERHLNRLTVLGSLTLFATLSFDVFWHTQAMNQTTRYIQLIVCIIFLYDFFVRRAHSPNKTKFLMRNWLLLVVSIPYSYIFSLTPLNIERGLYYLLHFMPVVRGLYAIGLILSWVGRSKSSTVFITYLGAMVSLIYFSSVLFFEYELSVNRNVHNYWQALWWACMDVTTVGSNIIAVTTVGKLLSVALAAMGMMMFPIFTTYILELYSKKDEK